jgi:hypothetical protein
MSSTLAIVSVAALAALSLTRGGSRSQRIRNPPKPIVAGAAPQDAVSAREVMRDLMRSLKAGPKGVAQDYLNESSDLLLGFYKKWLQAGPSSRQWSSLNELGDPPESIQDLIREIEEAGEVSTALVDAFLESDLAAITAFNEYAMDQLDEDFQPPSTAFYSPKLIRNAWLIHNSPSMTLDQKGFRLGVSDLPGLAYTGGARTFEHQRPGYSFAYLPEDHEYHGFDHGRAKYGDHFFAFWVPYAVVANHYADRERQVIFWGPSARNIFEIEKTEVSTKDGFEDRWIVTALGPRTIATESSEDLVDWLRDHWRQAKAYTQWVDASRRRVERGWSAEVVGKKTVKGYYGDEREVDVQADVYRGPGKGTAQTPRQIKR